MKAFFVRHRKLHIWLLAELALLAVFLAVRGNRTWMNALATHVTTPLRRAIGSLCYRVNFSVAEALCVILVVFSAIYITVSIVKIVQGRGKRLRKAYAAALGAVCIALTIYGGFCFLWGVDYYTDSFQDRSGIRASAVSTEDLTAVTQYFVQQLNAAADTVDRDADGLFAVPREQILAESTKVYGAVSQEFPFLVFDDQVPKSIYFSRTMSALDFTGVYCPFTGESNVNVDSPACMLPSTIAHELAHQRSISSEQECNFLSILACTTCGKVDYNYSGLLLGYIHLGNALCKADNDAWKAVYDSLDATVKADLMNNNDYWKQFQSGAVKKASNKVYDSFLKSYGETAGLQSYGTVVDLLVDYYRDAAK
ncbi:MAG: DUF3810 domain-containing protein [Oscillibacter sp.]|jgi:hypothetical protein|nr:DUF3810 domain-containing protein [Oscillibacter sp.]